MKIVSLIERLCGIVAGIFLFVILGIVATGTLSRYLFNFPFHFVEEYSGYLMVGMGFLGATYALNHGAHVRVDAIVGRLPKRARAGLELVTTLVAIWVISILFWYGLKLCLMDFKGHVVSSTIMQTPLWLPESFVWIGWLTLLLSLLVHLINKFKEFTNKVCKD
ncbi:MAG: TRAP transporter small permease [Deltaproteobacteria bacterium]|nr:TRAP transporter small permease [Deltaproteobacteria bacterium]